MKITHTCTQCGQDIIYAVELHGKDEAKEIKDQGFCDYEVYLDPIKPKVSVVMKVSSYQSNQEICRSCAIKALKKVVDELYKSVNGYL